MAAVMKVGKELIRKIRKEADLKPHRLAVGSVLSNSEIQG